MLLKEIFAKDFDLSKYDKKLLVNILLSDEDGLNIKTLYPLESNQINLKSAKDSMLRYKFIEKTNRADFFVITDAGLESMKRASLVDDTGELIEANASEYYYDELAS